MFDRVTKYGNLSLSLQKQPLLFPVADVLQLLSKVMAYGDATLKDIKIKVCDAKLNTLSMAVSIYSVLLHIHVLLSLNLHYIISLSSNNFEVIFLFCRSLVSMPSSPWRRWSMIM